MPQFSTRENRTVFVAVGNCLDAPLFHVATTTNSAELMVFLAMIQEARNDKLTGRKLWLILDGECLDAERTEIGQLVCFEICRIHSV